MLPSSAVSVALVAIGLWFFPIGALVMRRHLAGARGGLAVFKYLLYLLAILTLPFALFFTTRHFIASLIQAAGLFAG